MKKFHSLLCLVLLLGSLLLPNKSFSQLKKYRFEQIDTLQNREKRKIIIFIHTDWCQFCQAMQNTTFKNRDLIDKLNTNFYFIDLDAEETRDISFLGRTFRFKPSGNKTGIHELATELATINGKLAYPSLCILNTKYEIIFQYANYLNAEELLKILEKLK